MHLSKERKNGAHKLDQGKDQESRKEREEDEIMGDRKWSKITSTLRLDAGKEP